jgi:hypothetical protein
MLSVSSRYDKVMRINDNTSGVSSVAITRSDGAKASQSAFENSSEDSVSLDFADRCAAALREPLPAEVALTASVRNQSYDPSAQEIAAALIGKAFEL